MTAYKNLPGVGRVPAIMAKDLLPGTVVLLPYKGRAFVASIARGLKVVHLHLRGVETAFRVNVWKRNRSLVAVER